MYNLGAVAVEQNRLEDARQLLAQSIALSERVGDPEDLAWCLIALAAVAARTQQTYDGARMLGFTIALLDQIGATMKPFERRLYERTREALDSALGGAQLDAAISEGKRLRLSDAVTLASTLAPRGDPQAGRPALTTVNPRIGAGQPGRCRAASVATGRSDPSAGPPAVAAPSG